MLLLFSLLFLGFCDYILPSRTAFYEGEALPSYPCIQYEETEIIKNDTYSTSTVNVKLFGLIKVKEIEVSRFENLELVPGGYPFGIKVMTGGICVSEYTPVNAGGNVFFPAKEAGLAVGDVIVMIDGEKIISTTALTEKLLLPVGHLCCLQSSEAMKTLTLR